MNYTYTLFDLTLSVPFPCPLLTHAPTGTVPDVIMNEGPVPRSLPGSVAKGVGWQATTNSFLFQGAQQAGRFLIEDGKRITLQRNPEAKDDVLCAHLLASVIVALLRQRGNQVLHANVIDTPRGAVALSGVSGAGKTTTQAALLARGCHMVADDVSVLRLNEDSEVVALPGISKMNLCDDTAIKFGYEIDKLYRNPLRSGKVLVQVGPEAMVTAPVVLKTIYLLRCHPGNDLIVEQLFGTEKFIALQNCIYGPQLPEEHTSMFPIVSALADQVEMIRIDRPDGNDSLNKIVEVILHG